MIFADFTRNYKNANHPWEKNRTNGLGLIKYLRMELEEIRNSLEIAPFDGERDLFGKIREYFLERGANEHAVRYYNGETGTFWFQVEVTDRNGVVYRSAGISDSTDRGISTQVTRISVRESSDFLRFITSFFNVPGLFGSLLYQTKNHIGADCADLL